MGANRRQGVTFLAYPDPPPEDFAKRLKRLAKERGLNNKALAGLTGAHIVTVSRWMGGQEPETLALLILARLLDVSPDYLLTGKEPADGEDGAEPVLPKVGARPVTRAQLNAEKEAERKAAKKGRRA